MAFLGGLALLGSAGEAYDKIRHEKAIEDIRQQTLQWHQQRQDQLLQLAQQKQQASQMMPGAIASIFGDDGSGAPQATADSGNGNGGQYPPTQQPPAGAPPAGGVGPYTGSGGPDQQAQLLQALMAAGQARQQQGPPPGLPPPQQGGAPSFGDRFPRPGQAMQPPGQGDQMQPTPVQTQAFRPAGQQAPAQPAGLQPGKLYDVAPEGIPGEAAGQKQQDLGSQVAGDLPKNDAELFQRIQKKMPDLVNNPAFPELFKGLQKELKARQTQQRQDRVLKLQEDREKRIAEKEKKEGDPDPEAVQLGALEYYKTGRVTASGKGGEKFREAARKQAMETYGKVDPPSNWPTNWLKYKGESQFYRTANAMTARVDNAVNEAIQVLPLAINSSKEYWRGSIVPFNQLWNAFKRGTSDPKYNEFMANNFALINAYTRAMNPQGVPRVNDRLEQHAVGLLDIATSHEGYMAQVRQLWKEMQASKTATEQTVEGPSKGGDVNAPLPGEKGPPKTGDVEDGYRFKGGNPGDPNSWEKAQ